MLSRTPNIAAIAIGLGLLTAAPAWSGTRCLAPAFEWLPAGPISKYARVLKVCQDGPGPTRIATRAFVKGAERFYVLVDPDSLETSAVPESCLSCRVADPVTLGNTRFLRAVGEATAPQPQLQNVGIRHASARVNGYFLTVDLCPTRKAGFDEQIFNAMEIISSGASRRPPIGISISGAWLKKHRTQFEWLREQDKMQRLGITWINHTLTHPFNTHLPVSQNFLLEKGVNLDREILGMEELLLQNGVVPSVFIRFPGLVANRAIEATVRSYLLIPIAADAWLAKHESPTSGSIILIHGNENEEAGVSDFLNWLDSRRGEPASFLGVSELFEH